MIVAPPAALDMHLPFRVQVTIRNLRFLNGFSNGLPGGLIGVWGNIDVTFINCEFGGAIGGWLRSLWRVSEEGGRHDALKAALGEACL
jgi:hypothetical protein